MFKIFKAKKESRDRDKDRHRFILKFGKYNLHVTREELKTFIDDATDWLNKTEPVRKDRIKRRKRLTTHYWEHFYD